MTIQTHEVQAILELAEGFPDAACSEIAKAINEAKVELACQPSRKYSQLATLAYRNLTLIMRDPA